MAATYTSTSPYYLTGYKQFYLDVMVNRPIPKLADDLQFTINPIGKTPLHLFLEVELLSLKMNSVI